MSRFEKWVATYGRVRLSQKLGVTVIAVHKWMAGERVPRGDTILAIIKLSKGALSFEDIFTVTNRGKNK